MNREDWEERAQVGERRAAERTGPSLDDDVVRLMVETDDVGVTHRMATALIGRGDVLGLRHVLHAAVDGDDQINDVLGDAILTVRAETLGETDRWLEAALDDLVQAADPVEAVAARETREWLFGR